MPTKQKTGCMICGSELRYLQEEQVLTCGFCEASYQADAKCEKGHFVCDTCHAKEGLAVIEHICLTTKETNMLTLLQRIHEHPAIPMHGPEHHAMVAAIIVATYRSLGGKIGEESIQTVIGRGFKIPGGFCGGAGACGAAIGVGVAFAHLLGSSPIKPAKRRTSMRVTQAVLGVLTECDAARCCLRDSWLALRKAAELSRELLPITLRADADWMCEQWPKNKECLGKQCPLRPVDSVDS